MVWTTAPLHKIGPVALSFKADGDFWLRAFEWRRRISQWSGKLSPSEEKVGIAVLNDNPELVTKIPHRPTFGADLAVGLEQSRFLQSLVDHDGCAIEEKVLVNAVAKFRW
jgi:hypothetical protein